MAFKSNAARAGVATAIVVTLTLGVAEAWSFTHPAPCLPSDTHCMEEFSSIPAVRMLGLVVCAVTGAIAGGATWFGWRAAERMRRKASQRD